MRWAISRSLRTTADQALLNALPTGSKLISASDLIDVANFIKTGSVGSIASPGISASGHPFVTQEYADAAGFSDVGAFALAEKIRDAYVNFHKGGELGKDTAAAFDARVANADASGVQKYDTAAQTTAIVDIVQELIERLQQATAAQTSLVTANADKNAEVIKDAITTGKK